jgi:hypothetical protein
MSVHKVELWYVNFSDVDYRTRIGPWLLLRTETELRRIERWEHTEGRSPGSVPYGDVGTYLQLSARQRLQLIARGIGWPWNGYELMQMYQRGEYPPQRLTPLRRLKSSEESAGDSTPEAKGRWIECF